MSHVRRRRALFVAVPALAASLLAFQNCQDFKMSDQFMLSQAAYAMDLSAYNSLTSAPEFVGAYQVGTGTSAQSVSGLSNGLDQTLLPASKLDLSLLTSNAPPILMADPASGQPMLQHTVSATGATVQIAVNDNPLFAPAQRAILSNCAGCHAGFSTMKPTDYVAGGWLVGGNSAGSKIYQRLTTTDTNLRMPKGGSALGSNDIAAIKAWIDGYTPAPQAMGTNPILTTSNQDNLVATNFSLAVVARKPLAHDILSINAGSRGQDDLSIAVESNQIYAIHYTDSANYTYVALPVPDQDSVVIAASFDKDSSKIILTVNGVSSSTVKSIFPLDANGKMVGAGPSDSSYVLRQFQLGSSQSGGKVTWGEARLFVKALTQYQLNVLSRQLASRWNVPNVADDPAARGAATGGTSTVSTPEFLAASTVLQNNCLGCHTEWVGKKSKQFVSLGMIVPGAPGSSPIYQRINGIGGAQMPQGKSALSTDEVQEIAAWINSEK